MAKIQIEKTFLENKIPREYTSTLTEEEMICFTIARECLLNMLYEQSEPRLFHNGTMIQSELDEYERKIKENLNGKVPPHLKKLSIDGRIIGFGEDAIMYTLAEAIE